MFFLHFFCRPQALGSVVTAFYSDSAAMLLSNGMVISMGLSGGLLYVSHWIGGQFDLYTATGYVVGDDESAAAVQGISHMLFCQTPHTHTHTYTPLVRYKQASECFSTARHARVCLLLQFLTPCDLCDCFG